MRVIVAGGGTGGHVIPALAIAQELRAAYRRRSCVHRHAARYRDAAGSGRRLRAAPDRGGRPESRDLATRMKTVVDLPRAIMASAAVIREFRPDVMIGVGGYASGPAMLAAAMHERSQRRV